MKSELWSVTVPGYATGVGTVLLVLVTAAVLYVDRQRDQREARRDARKVFAIAEQTEHQRKTPGTTRLRMRLPSRFWRELDLERSAPVVTDHLTIVNAGPDPIFNVSASVDPIEKTLGHPGFGWNPGLHQYSLPFVLPNERDQLAGTWGNWTEDGEFHQEQLPYWAYAQLQIRVEWTDARGLSWYRMGSSNPVPSKPPKLKKKRLRRSSETERSSA